MLRTLLEGSSLLLELMLRHRSSLGSKGVPIGSSTVSPPPTLVAWTVHR
jgi:hypothetical protein